MRYSKKIVIFVFCLFSFLFIPAIPVMASSQVQAPQMLSIEPGEGTNALTVTWSQIANITNYSVYRSESLTDGYVQVAAVTQNSYTDTGLSTDKNYYYMICANVIAGQNTVSSDFSGIGLSLIHI